MAFMDEVGVRRILGDLHLVITQETDTKLNMLKTQVNTEVDGKLINLDQNIRNDMASNESILNDKFKQAIILLETSITDLQHQSAQCIGGIATAEVKINEALGSKIFEEKSREFADLVSKHLVTLKLNTDDLEGRAKQEFLKYQEVLKDIESRAGE